MLLDRDDLDRAIEAARPVPHRIVIQTALPGHEAKL